MLANIYVTVKMSIDPFDSLVDKDNFHELFQIAVIWK